jgi:chromosome segregation ATPase
LSERLQERVAPGRAEAALLGQRMEALGGRIAGAFARMGAPGGGREAPERRRREIGSNCQRAVGQAKAAEAALRNENRELRAALSQSRESERLLRRQVDEQLRTMAERAQVHERSHSELCQAASGMDAALSETRARERAFLIEKLALQAALSKISAKPEEWAARSNSVFARLFRLEAGIDRLRECVTELSKVRFSDSVSH